MEYTDKDFVDPDIHTELKIINTCLKKIDEFNTKYSEKSKIIDDKIISLSNKQYLDIVSSLDLLRYQQDLINNERLYLKNLNKIFNNELQTQIYYLSEKVTIMYMSLQNINKEINNDINKSIRRSFKKDNYTKIINDILYNFTNIKLLLLKLKEYNINLNKELQNKNFHCRTLDHNIHKKRILIYINYQKFHETFVTIIKYFYDHALTIIDKLNNDKHYTFLVNSNELNNNVEDENVFLESNIMDNDSENNTSEE